MLQVVLDSDLVLLGIILKFVVLKTKLISVPVKRCYKIFFFHKILLINNEYVQYACVYCTVQSQLLNTLELANKNHRHVCKAVLNKISVQFIRF